MIEEAKQLIELGLPIIPICSHNHANTTTKHNERCKCPGKTPLIKEWQSHDNTTLTDLASWAQSFKTFNIGLPLGDASGYCGIDVDGEEGVNILMQMSKGDLPATWEFITGAGNRLIYLIPEGLQTKKFKQAGAGAHEECALLCTGQQTVLPPSIHHTGKVYEWVEDHSPWELDCAMAPQWLINNITKDNSEYAGMSIDFTTPIPTTSVDMDDEFSATDFQDNIPDDVKLANKNVRTQTGKSGHKIVVTDELLTQPISEGSRDNTMTAIVGHYCANRDLRRFGKPFILQICIKHNNDFCNPPLEEQAIIDKVDYFFEAEQLKDAEYADKKKAVFEASKMAKNVLQYLVNGGVHLHFDQFSKCYYYASADKGPWHPTRNYTLINKWIRDVITSAHYGDGAWDKRSYIDETRTALEEQFTAAYKSVDDFDLGAHAKELREYIVVNNGMVDWQNKMLVDWDPIVKTTIAFDIDYDVNAACPKFEEYLAQWLPDSQVRLVIQEFLGYCLIPNTNYRKALFLYGKGKNGKSMLVEFLQDFFGEHSAALSYDGLFTRFGTATLKDKLVNIFDDTTVAFSKETSTAKNLIAGGTISAEFKGGQIFQFQNIARLIYSSQETPRTADNTVAWRDRWFFIKFPNQFRPSNLAKTQIQDDLEREKAGIFNWMLTGLQRLMENDDFTYSDTLALSTIEYQSQNDSVAQFVHNMCISSSTEVNRITITDLYAGYNIWSDHESLRPVSKKVFVQRVSDMGYEKEKAYINGKSGQTCFKDLLWNLLSEDYQEIAMELSIAFSQH